MHCFLCKNCISYRRFWNFSPYMCEPLSTKILHDTDCGNMLMITCLQYKGARSPEASPPRFPQTWEARLRSHYPRCLLVVDPGDVSSCLRARSASPPPRLVLDAPHSTPPPRAPQTQPCSQAAPQRRLPPRCPHPYQVLLQSRPGRPTFPLGHGNSSVEAHSAKKQRLQLLYLRQEFQNQTWGQRGVKLKAKFASFYLGL